MANYKIAEQKTGKNEGLYANNPADTGGETWAGISRNNWPSWVGWKKIDSIKSNYGKSATIINKYGKSDTVLSDLVSNFYKSNFWDVLRLDVISDQQLAETVYDFGVNSGTGRAAKFLQQAANDTGLTNLVIDGAIGVKSIAAINALSPQNVHANYNRRRKAFYESIATGSQKQFLKSWLSRLKDYKTCA